MGYVLTVAGTPFVPDASTFSLDAALEQRTTFDFGLTQTDPASFIHVKQGMAVLLTNNGTPVFRGVVDSAEEDLTAGTILHTTVRCSDNHCRADRRLAVKSYANALCGDMASDLSATYLAAEAVVGYHKSRTETSQADWQAVNGGGALDSHLDATTAPGDLRLALHSTSTVSYTPTSQTDFDAGTKSSVQSTASGPSSGDLYQDGYLRDWNDNLVTSQTLYTSNSGSQSASSSKFHLTTPNTGLVWVGSSLDGAGTFGDFQAAVDFTLNSGSPDHTGIFYRSTGLGNAWGSYAYYANYSKVSNQVQLLRGTNSSGGGAPTTVATASLTLTTGNTYTLLVVVSGSNHKVYINGTLYINSTDATYSAAGALGLGTYNCTNTTMDFDNFGVTSGTSPKQWVSPGTALSGAVLVSSSSISWTTSGETGGNSILVETSTDNGSTWSTASNGGAIPGLSAMTSLSGKTLKVRATWTIANPATATYLQAISASVVGQGYYGSGQRISPALDLSGVDQARATTVSWTQTLNGETITIEASTDGGATWQTLSNGGSIPQVQLWSAPILEGFDADNSGLYTSSGSGSWTWDVANSQLIGSGSGSGVTRLVASSGLFQAQDALLQADTSQCGGIGFYARYTDASNHYYTEVYDDGAPSSPNTATIWKRVAGTATQLATTSISLHRGDIHRLGFQVQGSSLQLLVDGVVVCSATDSSLSGSGQVGARLAAVADTSYVLNAYAQAVATSLSGVSLLLRQTLGSDGFASPVLSDLTVSFKSALIQDGPSVPSAVFSYVKVSDALDSLATRANYTWWIDASNRLHFVPRSTTPAPFMVATHNGIMLEGTVKVTHGNPTYRNTQYITGGLDQTVPQTETRKGDGATRTFILSYPLAKVPTVTVNAVAKTVGILGVDSGKDWYWQAGSDTLTQDQAGTLLTSSDTLQVVYTGQFPVVTMSQDYAGVLSTQAIEADGSGVVEEVESVPESTTASNSLQIGAALLSKYSLYCHTLVFDTDQSGFQEGQLLYASVPEHDLVGVQMLISQVRTQDKGGADPGNLRYTITAVEGPIDGGWVKLFANLIPNTTSQDSINLGSSQSLTVLVPATSESYTWAESVVETPYTCPVPSTSLFPGTTLYPC